MKPSLLCLLLLCSLSSPAVLQAALVLKNPAENTGSQADKPNMFELQVERLEEATQLENQLHTVERTIQKNIKGAKSSEDDTPGLLSLVFGIISILLLIIPALGLLSIAFAIASFVLGIIGIIRKRGKRMAIVGLVISSLIIIGALIAAVVLLFFWI